MELVINVTEETAETLEILADTLGVEVATIAGKLIGKSVAAFRDEEIVRNVLLEKESLNEKLDNLELSLRQTLATRFILTNMYMDISNASERVEEISLKADEIIANSKAGA